ncbi:MAG: ABC transporter permease [Patescibacteria group bacterium]|nr:ABC transporter permease [Patescibacteria group bacterium]
MQELKTSIKLAFSVLRSNKTRTILSLLGIVIGVTAVILVLSLGAGLKKFVVDQVESFGTGLFEIEIKTPNVEQASTQNASSIAGGVQITTFKIEDAEEVAKNPVISAWYGGNIGQQIVSYRGRNEQPMIFAVTEGIEKADENFEIVEGEMFTREDDKNLKQVVVLGNEIKEDLFGDSSAVGKSVKIKGQSYKVIGVLKERGGTTFLNFDKMVYVPTRTFHKRIAGIDYIMFAMFKVDNDEDMPFALIQAKEIMRERHDVSSPDEEDFAVLSMAEAAEMLDQIFVVINILLLSLTSVSLVVGGVGITNVMYVAVTERTFEIGLRKAVGAKRSDILKQFLFEAVILTLLGGLGGILIGFTISKIAEYVLAHFGYTLEFPLTLLALVLGVGFSAVTGLVFGLRPAQTASKLSPMEALRKE